MSGKDKIIDLKKGIRRKVVKFIAGCILFALMAACTIISAVLLILNPGLDFPHGIWILAVGGVVLLWEMGRAFWVRSPLPEGYAAVSRADCPPLFSLIDEVAENLGVKLPEQIYVCPDASAAVFVMPGIQNLIRAPEDRYLVVGLGFLTQMDDEEIKSVLYHEFGHYVQAATDDSASVYVVGQFSRSFISGDKNEVSNIWQMNACNQKLLFGYSQSHGQCGMRSSVRDSFPGFSRLARTAETLFFLSLNLSAGWRRGPTYTAGICSGCALSSLRFIWTGGNIFSRLQREYMIF